MDNCAIHDRVSRLLKEVARIHDANQQYLVKTPRYTADDVCHSDREARLLQILEELAGLSKKKLA